MIFHSNPKTHLGGGLESPPFFKDCAVPISYISLGLFTLTAMSMGYPESSSPYALSGLLIGISIFFYYTVVKVFVGLSYVVAGTSENLTGVWQTRAIEYVALFALYSLEFYNILYFVLPSILMMTLIDIVVSLVQMGIISIEFPDDTQSNEEDEQ